MRRIFCLIIVSALCLATQAQSPKDFGFIAHSFSTKKLGRVDFYVSDTLHDQQKLLLLYLDGSGNDPLFSTGRDSSNKPMRYSTVLLNLRKLSLQYHIVLISKPHTAFAGVATEEHIAIADSVYDQYASADWRVRSASKAMDYVVAHYKVAKNKIMVFGFSEGEQVAPQLAAYNKKITHCIAFTGGGLNQFYDEVIRNRLLAAKGEIPAEEAQRNIDTLYMQYAAIYANPQSVKEHWYGHTYLRWSSYTRVPVIEYLKQLEIPVYIAQGTADENASILGADYTKLEFLRLGKTNLTFKAYPDCDHSLINTKTGQSMLSTAIAEAFSWLDSR